MTAENVKVIVRCRPMNSKELEMQSKPVVKMKDCMVEITDPNEDSNTAFPKQFTFDSVYDQNSVTEVIYNDICYPLIESVLEGYNSTIFVYGQTGCGKSFSMEGNKHCSPPEKGIISRSFDHIFEAISVAPETKYLALVSYLEIYNEQIRDLLVPQSEQLPLKESPNEGVTVPGLTQKPVHNATECEELLKLGSKNRIVGATLMNQNSSRSHSIFTISIEQLHQSESIRKGKLNLVDLAGSERQAKTGATGDRLKEATKINLSLSALGNVISALVDGKAKHIPYRDSKLTRLLQDSLGGNTRTLMIACLSPASRNYVETLSTLRYANRAKNISNKPKVNEDPKDAILREYQGEIERLKKMLETSGKDLRVEDVDEESYPIAINENNNNFKSDDLDKERDRLIENYEKEMEKLKGLHQDEKTQKENVLKQMNCIREEYQKNIEALNMEMRERSTKGVDTGGRNNNEMVPKEEILHRIEMLKAAMIGGERANDKELSERRRRKKLASERRLSAIAHVLAKMEMHEDRELLQNQYKDISQELNLKTEALRRFRHKVKSLEKEVSDIQAEFESEREDYLETIRKQEMNVKLLTQICERIAATLKAECNYRDLDAIKEQAVWSDDRQKFRLPELAFKRTKLPPAGQNHNRLASSSNSEHSAPTSPPENIERRYDSGDIIGNYFRPNKRATELLNQSLKMLHDDQYPQHLINQQRSVVPSYDSASTTFNTWRDFAQRRNSNGGGSNFSATNNNYVGSPKTISLSSPAASGGSRWSNNGNHNNKDGVDLLRRPMRLEALPNIGAFGGGFLRKLDH